MFSRNYFIFSRFVRKYNSIDQLANSFYYYFVCRKKVPQGERQTNETCLNLFYKCIIFEKIFWVVHTPESKIGIKAFPKC